MTRSRPEPDSGRTSPWHGRRRLIGGLVAVAVVLGGAGIAVAAFTSSTSSEGSFDAVADCPSGLTVPAAVDTWVDESAPTDAHGTEQSLFVHSGAGAQREALLRFAIPEPPTGCTVLTAVLSLVRTSSTGGERTLVAQPADGAFDADTTWETRPGVTGQLAYAPSGDAMDFDVTTPIRDVLAGSAQNHGFVIADSQPQSGTASQQIHSSETSDAIEGPQLTVTFAPNPD